MKRIIYLLWDSAGPDEKNMSVREKRNESKTEMEGEERGESREQTRAQQNKRGNSKYDIRVS